MTLILIICTQIIGVPESHNCTTTATQYPYYWNHPNECEDRFAKQKAQIEALKFDKLTNVIVQVSGTCVRN